VPLKPKATAMGSTPEDLYKPPIGCGPADTAVPAASDWNSPYASVEPFEIDGAAMLTSEPSTWIYVLGAALLTLVIKWKTLFH
jgi:hypothetical protein